MLLFLYSVANFQIRLLSQGLLSNAVFDHSCWRLSSYIELEVLFNHIDGRWLCISTSVRRYLAAIQNLERSLSLDSLRHGLDWLNLFDRKSKAGSDFLE